MESLKLPVEKVFFFVAGIIPGFVALLIFDLAAPGSFVWFFNMGFLGYKTKLCLILLTAFIVGNSMTSFLNFFMNFTGGAIGAVMAKKTPFQPPTSYQVAPWRDKVWRAALRRHVGGQTPGDTTLMTEAIFNIKLQTIALLPEANRPQAVDDLNREKFRSETDDSEWCGLYNHYHSVTLTSRERWDVQRYFYHGLNFNLATAALYVLASALIVPRLRHWWCILPALIWALIFAAEQIGSLVRFRDPWSTLSEQVQYFAKEVGTDNPEKNE